MKRWSVTFALGALILSMALLSCDAMFEGNIFAGMVKRDLSTAAVNKMTNDEVAALAKSDTAMQTMAEDDDAKAAVLTKLESTYNSGDATPEERQTAALAAGTIEIGTVPEAKAFSEGLVTTVIDLMASSDASSDFDVEATMDTLIPSDFDSFATIVATFQDASPAYSALNDSLAGTTLETTTLTSEEVASASINALLCFVIDNVTVGADADPNVTYDLGTSEGVAQLLWDQQHAEPISVDPNTGENVYPSIATFPAFDSTSTAGISNILDLIGLSDLFNETTTP